MIEDANNRYKIMKRDFDFRQEIDQKSVGQHSCNVSRFRKIGGSRKTLRHGRRQRHRRRRHPDDDDGGIK